MAMMYGKPKASPFAVLEKAVVPSDIERLRMYEKHQERMQAIDSGSSALRKASYAESKTLDHTMASRRAKKESKSLEPWA